MNPSNPVVTSDQTRKYIYYGCLSILLLGLAYRWWNILQTTPPIQIAGQTIDLPTVQSKISQAQLSQQRAQIKLSRVKKVENFVRYQNAQYLDRNVDFFNRYTNTRNLTTIYDRLQEISSANQINISSFIIKNDSIQIKGEVSDMQVMYGTAENPGLIKKFSSLKFLDKIDIPYYKKNGDMFEFTLVAMIQNASQSSDLKSKSTTNSNTTWSQSK
jgi:uncharacterized protein YlbG (UPF0298 family)